MPKAIPKTMKAVLLKGYGGFDQLDYRQDVPVPAPQAGEVLIRVAAAGILLGLPEIKLGLIPGFGGTQRLPRIIGPSNAAELILTGETVTSEEALTLGLVNRVVPPEEVLLTAQRLAGMITAKGRLATQAALRAIRTGLDSPLAEGLAREAELFGELCETPDKKEGTTAFLEKRPPRFS